MRYSNHYTSRRPRSSFDELRMSGYKLRMSGYKLRMSGEMGLVPFLPVSSKKVMGHPQRLEGWCEGSEVPGEREAERLRTPLVAFFSILLRYSCRLNHRA